ncbi:HNH endonuclease signature motif containing protein [[Mycobacterium] crassicus]|uniref:DUF222 domain-containing protein n=1 Tax=[Mycobacterium] crassicus TaxID=2872309 RepID=A0ABU5XD84_9MYCO|nr:HNH endonuclease signature motif containing protein [Mycolicibacter sp. MYC098]MEB3020271.1 DUF222 domain-containing protein [Mycolicibacter sp. MYC098]
MFDLIDLPDSEALAEADESALIAAIGGWAQAEAVAAAHRLAAIAELVGRKLYDDPTHSKWACDGWDSVAAQVSAACDISHGKASGQMYLASALRERLPKVAALFAAGQLNAALVSTISWHTTLIQDRRALAAVDTALAADALHYGPLSAFKTAQAIDAVIEAHDPEALRRSRETARSRDLVVDKRNTDHATTPLWGRLHAHDAEALDRRLMAMAHSVCDDDPRTIAQRRADALGALAAGGQSLVCGCGNEDCPGTQDRPASSVLIHVVANAESMGTGVDAHRNGEEPPPPPIDRRNPFAPIERPAEPDPPPKAPPALLLGGPLIPAPMLAELIAAGARIKRVRHPGPDSAPEPRYRPSTALDEFLRCRDMTCRWPGCDRPAELCDLDHAIAYGLGGPTHPSNLRCLCRKHHLLKTFHGWRDRQHTDGTIDWLSPTGQTYTTHPGSRLLFPALCEPTGRLPAPTDRQPDSACRTLMMPTRRRTRAQNRAQAIIAERALNTRPPPS